MQHFVAINCDSISPSCPVEDTIYGYYPSIGFNSFFVAFFALGALIHALVSIRTKTYFFSIVIIFGCIAEAIGYGGRVMMHSNPFGHTAFTMQISCLIFAPAFIAAGIYVVLQHIVQTFGAATSRLPALYYTRLFISCDLLSLILQAVGGGLAGSSKGNEHKRDIGTDLAMAGIVWQVITQLFFIGLVVDYVVRTSRAWSNVAWEAKMQFGTRSFQLFIGAVTLAYTAIFIRCVYRVAELSGGWASPLMRNEGEYIALEGFMVVIAVLALTVCHPGWCFPVMGKKVVSKTEDLEQSSMNTKA